MRLVSLHASVVTTTIEPSVVASIEAASVMTARIATVMSNIMGMPMMLQPIAAFGDIEIRLARGLYIFRTHLLNGAPVGTKTEPCRPDSRQHQREECNRKYFHTGLVAGASAAATAAAARES